MLGTSPLFSFNFVLTRKFFSLFFSRNGQQHGDGQFVWDDGSFFVGEFKYNERTYGVTIFSNDTEEKVHPGKKHTGHYVNDQREGAGNLEWMINHQGAKYDGWWSKHKLIGSLKIPKHYLPPEDPTPQSTEQPNSEENNQNNDTSSINTPNLVSECVVSNDKEPEKGKEKADAEDAKPVDHPEEQVKEKEQHNKQQNEKQKGKEKEQQKEKPKETGKKDKETTEEDSKEQTWSLEEVIDLFLDELEQGKQDFSQLLNLQKNYCYDKNEDDNYNNDDNNDSDSNRNAFGEEKSFVEVGVKWPDFPGIEFAGGCWKNGALFGTLSYLSYSFSIIDVIDFFVASRVTHNTEQQTKL